MINRKDFLILTGASLVATSLSMAETNRRLLVVLIGIDSYGNRYVELHCAGADAQRLGEVLRDQFSPSKAVIVAGGVVKSDEIRSKLEDIASKADPDDILLFAFSGHGVIIGAEQYLITSDTNPVKVADTALSLSTLEGILKKCKAKSRILLIDACRRIRTAPAKVEKGGIPPFDNNGLPEGFQQRVDKVSVAGPDGVEIRAATLFACSPNESAYEPDIDPGDKPDARPGRKRISVFMQLVVDALAGGIDKATITTADLEQYTVNHIPADLKGKQRPILLGDRGLALERIKPPTERLVLKLTDACSMEFAHIVRPEGSYYMQTTHVTVEQFKEFCKADGWAMPRKPDWGWIDEHPILDVTPEDIGKFCNWATKQAKRTIELPSEAQFNFAAGGPNHTRYPWGNEEPTAQNADRLLWCSLDSEKKGPTSVGRFPTNGFGLYDMAGNGWHWTSTPFEKGSKLKVVRGGSWADTATDYFTTSNHLDDNSVKQNSTQVLGFRCVTY